MKLLRVMFTRRWFLATLLVIFGVGLCIRLGIWQLDRLEKRRAFNTRVLAQIYEAPLELSGTALEADLYNMEYRSVEASGVYDFANQIALRNQYYGNEWGFHLVTPFILEDSQQVILVDRGWIPAKDGNNQTDASGDWAAYDEPGLVEITGILRRPQSKAEIGSRSDPTPVPGAAPLKTWYFINIEQISKQVSYPLLPAYIQQAPQDDWKGPPFRTQPELELSEGPHMGYALQWFTFATLLGLGYPFFIRKQQKGSAQADQQTHQHQKSFSGA